MALVPASSHGGGLPLSGGTLTGPVVIADTNNNDVPFQENLSLSGINVNMWAIHSTDGGGTDIVYIDSGGTFYVQDAAGDFVKVAPAQLQVHAGGQTKLQADATGVELAGSLGVYGKTPIAQQTGVPVTAAGIHAACVALGLFTA